MSFLFHAQPIAELGSDFPVQRGKDAPNMESMIRPVTMATTPAPTFPATLLIMAVSQD